jgi:hypothetical protein
MDQAERRALIERYEEGARVVDEAVRTLTDAQLDARPAPDAWTAREVIHHLADSEMTSAIRLRKLIAEEQPTLYGYDEALFARKLYYDRPVDASLEAIRAARRTSAEILKRLTEAEWQRAGTHTESGPYSVETWLEICAKHAHDHAAQLARAAEVAVR